MRSLPVAYFLECRVGPLVRFVGCSYSVLFDDGGDSVKVKLETKRHGPGGLSIGR